MKIGAYRCTDKSPWIQVFNYGDYTYEPVGLRKKYQLYCENSSQFKLYDPKSGKGNLFVYENSILPSSVVKGIMKRLAGKYKSKVAREAVCQVINGKHQQFEKLNSIYSFVNISIDAKNKVNSIQTDLLSESNYIIDEKKKPGIETTEYYYNFSSDNKKIILKSTNSNTVLECPGLDKNMYKIEC